MSPPQLLHPDSSSDSSYTTTEQRTTNEPTPDSFLADPDPFLAGPDSYPPPPDKADPTPTLYPPPPQFIDSDGTLESLYVQIRGPDNTYVNIPNDDITPGVDPTTGEPIYQNMSPMRNPRHSADSGVPSSTDSGVPSSTDSGVPPSISSLPPDLPTPAPPTNSFPSADYPNKLSTSAADYTNNLIIPRKYRPSSSTTTLVRIPSVYSEHPVSCYTPALHATRRALRKVRQNFSKRKSRSGESSRKNSGNEYDEYVIPETNHPQVETYVLNDFVFSRL